MTRAHSVARTKLIRLYRVRYLELLEQEKRKVEIPPHKEDPVAYKKAYSKAHNRAKTLLIHEYKWKFLELYRGAVRQGYTIRD